MTVDELAKADAALLDGCYVLETTSAKEKMDAATVDARYRDLSQVEQDFRTLKTVHLEVRPVYLRKAERTRGHAVAAMLALRIAREMRTKLAAVFGTTRRSPGDDARQMRCSTLSRWCFLRDRMGSVEYLRLPGLDDGGLGILEPLASGHRRWMGEACADRPGRPLAPCRQDRFVRLGHISLGPAGTYVQSPSPVQGKDPSEPRGQRSGRVGAGRRGQGPPGNGSPPAIGGSSGVPLSPGRLLATRAQGRQRAPAGVSERRNRARRRAPRVRGARRCRRASRPGRQPPISPSSGRN